MASSVRTAVILAAGLGSRLKDMTKERPKGLVEVDGIPLVRLSSHKLRESGIERIILGLGYLGNVYESLAPQEGWEFAYNPEFSSTGSMATLSAVSSLIDETFLLLESDLLYDRRALEVLINDPRDTVMLASGTTQSNDEVWMSYDEDTSRLIDLSKAKEDLAYSNGELVGISKISKETLTVMCDDYEKRRDSFPKLDYEKSLVYANASSPVFVHKVDDLIWTEIDNKDHYDRALTDIYPKIQHQSQGIRL